MKIKFYLFIYILFTYILFSACNKCSTTDPPVVINPMDTLKPGTSYYKWTLDSVKVPGSDIAIYSRVMASSPDNIWLSGAAFSYPIDIMQYDGKKWNAKSFPLKEMVTDGLWVFDKNNVWITTTLARGSFFQYNGTSWVNRTTIVPKKNERIQISDIYANSPNDMYAVGTFFTMADTSGYSYDVIDKKGVIIKWDGVKWSYVDFGNNRREYWSIWRKNKQENKYYITADHDDNGTMYFDSLFVLQWDKDKNKIDEVYTMQTGNKTVTVNKVGDNCYVNINSDLYDYKNGKLEMVFDSPFSDGSISGRHWKDLFIYSNYILYHYNGSKAQGVQSVTKFDKPYLLTPDFYISDRYIMFYVTDAKAKQIIVVKGEKMP